MSKRPTPPSGALIERLQRRRTRVLFTQAILFLLWQTTFFSMHEPATGRLVDHVRTVGYIAWVVVLLAFIASGGALGQPREVRAILNDESTREHRRRALEMGFWAAIAAALGCFV